MIKFQLSKIMDNKKQIKYIEYLLLIIAVCIVMGIGGIILTREPETYINSVNINLQRIC